MLKLTTIISYCSLDKQYIDKTIENALMFSDEIIVATCTHLFSGVPDDLSYNEELKRKYPSIKFTVVQYDKEMKVHFRYWNCLERWQGYQAARNDYIFFLDSDEIPDGPLMKKYLEETDVLSQDIIMFSCYWYFREPTLRSNTEEFCGAIYRKSVLSEELMFNHLERWAYIHPMFNHLRRLERQKYHGQTIMHHFSWVRSKEEMLKKAANFAHSTDKDWASLIEEEFKRPFNGTDFVHGYSFSTVPNIFNIKENQNE